MAKTSKASRREKRRLVDLFEKLIARDARPARDEAISALDLHWYVLTVSPLCEKAVASRLKRWSPGLATYIPTARRRRQRSHRRETVDQVLFPRYLFVGFEAHPQWLYVFETIGVQGVLGVDGKPAEIEASVVGNLMWLCDSGQLAPAEPPKIMRGMQVVAERGLYRGFEGRVMKVRKQTAQVEVLFEMFSSTPIPLRLDDVVSIAYACDRMTG